MKTYLLIHSHAYGISVFPFKSKTDITGWYSNESEDIDKQEITDLGKKAGAFIEFEKNEFVDITKTSLKNIPII